MPDQNRSADQRFAGQVVVVTGATSGIGRAVARDFAGEGARVVGTGRDQGRLMEMGSDVELALTLDVTDPASVAAAAQVVADRFGAVDVLVNNAGIGLFESWDATPEEALQRVLEVNLLGVSRVTRAFLPAMVAKGAGTVVQVASVAGRRGYPNHTAYCASKHGLIGWSRALRKDLRGTGVQVVVICPPAVDTPFFVNAGYLTFDEDHPGHSLMSADEVARQLLDATAGGELERVLGARSKMLDVVDRFAPSFVDRLQVWKNRR